MENKNNAVDNANNTSNGGFASVPHGKSAIKGSHQEDEEKRSEQMTEKDDREVRASTNKTENEEMADIGQIGPHPSDNNK